MVAWLLSGPLLLRTPAAPPSAATARFLEAYCFDCHDADEKKGGLDLSGLEVDLAKTANFEQWVKVFDRIQSGEMPPKKKPRPEPGALATFSASLQQALTAREQAATARDGRSTQRRLNRYEYENTLRDLLGAPWLQVKEWLPEDGEANRFNKSGDALDVSHVQMARYMGAADYALREVIAGEASAPATRTVRCYTREERTYIGKMTFNEFNRAPERATFPVLGSGGQPAVRAEKAPITIGAADPKVRDQEGMGVVAGSYEPITPQFNHFRAPVAGRYRLRLKAASIWVGPGKDASWWIPDLDTVSVGRRPEPVTLYSIANGNLRRLGAVDVTPDGKINEMEAWLLEGESIRPDASRLFRSRPGPRRWQNPLAEKDGQPGVAFYWLEAEGPLLEGWPGAGHKLLFGDLPLKKGSGGLVEVVSSDPHKDAERLLQAFLKRAWRKPVTDGAEAPFVAVVDRAMKDGSRFVEAMLAAYTAVLCSPDFLYLQEKPGRLDDFALASRLSYFLWNSEPDAALRALAASGQLHQPAVLRAQTDRLLNDPKSRRFVTAFLDYWLDLRKIEANAPDSGLYPDYYLDDWLLESAREETQLFFAELLKSDLPARNLVASDFAIVNERLAAHYGLPPVSGTALRRVPVPAASPRGGLLTQASVLAVTANGTTTSPVVRGAWVMERLLGQPPPPPPPTVPAIEPDVRGASTVRQQLEKHRSQASCATCHAKIDPAGFALENFDVFGGWRDRYRALGGGTPEKGLGKNGQRFEFHLALPVDAAGQLPNGRKFSDIKEFKRLLLADEAQIARNLASQLVVYATGAPVRFSDRPQIEQILQRTAQGHFPARSLVHQIVQSDLFLNK